MKNNISYYYNLDISTIHQKDKNYYFKIADKKYLFLKYEDNLDLESIYKLDVYLLQFLPIYKIILNIAGKIVTTINDNNYLLLEINNFDKKIDINEIIKLNNFNIQLELPNLRMDNWYILWTKKVDYLEYQLSQIGRKYPLIRDSFNYYIGLAENAISLVNSVDYKNIVLGLSHRRIKDNFDLYNPLNIVIDIRIRDICEYFKFNFFNNIDIKNELLLFLNYNNFDINEKKLFLARMLFPTYYFDLYERIINNEVEEKEIKKIINKVDDFEKILKQIYHQFKNNQLIIEWLD